MVVTIKADGLSIYYGNRCVLSNVSFVAKPGEVTVVIGPNGAGKTTLLKTLAGIIPPNSGDVFFNNNRLSRMRREYISKFVSYLPQENVVPGILTVFEVVLLGRVPHLTWKLSEEDIRITTKTMEELGIKVHAKKYANQLSGGERQVVLVAQALVREPEVLLLDEPVSNLDIRNKLEILDLIKNITEEKKVTTLIVLHDLNLAAKYADELIVLSGGKVYAKGNPHKVLNESIIQSVYGIEAEIVKYNGGSVVIPLRSVTHNLQSSYRLA